MLQPIPIRRFRLSLLSLIAPAALQAQATQQGGATVDSGLMPRDQEIALALSAAPAPVADRAGVYVLESKGYVKARESTNGYWCIVQRGGNPLNRSVICHDPNGSATILQQEVMVAELRLAGKTNPEIQVELAQAYRTGKLRVPKPGGMAYMLSPDAYWMNGTTKVPYVPAVLIYAPYGTIDDLGVDRARAREMRSAVMPFMVFPGTPTNYIVVELPHVTREVMNGLGKAKP